MNELTRLAQKFALLVMVLNTMAVTVGDAEAQNRAPKAAVGPMERLKEAPRDLPYVPQITPPGSQFLFGMKKTKETGGTSLSLRYGTSSPPGSTLKFYQDSLKQYGWTVTSSSATNMSAINQGNNVVVQLVPASGRQYPYDIQVIYQLRK